MSLIRPELVYLASPYSSPHPVERDYRYLMACKAAAYLIKQGYEVFSPIAHSHGIAMVGDGLQHSELWYEADRRIFDICDLLVVAKIDGWDNSKGVQMEIGWARNKGIPIEYLEQEQFDPLPAQLPTVIRYFGGKFKLRKRICELLPEGGEPYCEPFCGAAAVLLARRPAPAEVLNDLHKEVINLYRVMQKSETFWELHQMISNTLYHRDELRRALDMPDDASPVERAWATFVRFQMGTSGREAKSIGDWGRERRCMSRPVTLFNRFGVLPDIQRRIRYVQFDCRDAIDCIHYWDSENAVFYCDPPYHLDTRKGRGYRHEIDGDYHERLVDVLLNVKGSVVLSCYDHPVYHKLMEHGWRRYQTTTRCTSSNARHAGHRELRIETAYQNPKAYELTREHLDSNQSLLWITQ